MTAKPEIDNCKLFNILWWDARADEWGDLESRCA